MMSGTIKQTLYGTGTILFLSLVCHYFRETLNYRVVALLFLLVVSLSAILSEIIPVVVTAILSAFVLNFFFMDPLYNYKINSSESTLLFFVYISVALVGGILSNRIRRQEQKLRTKEEKENTLKLYNTLLNSLSHELRIPISAIIGAVDTLKLPSLPEEFRAPLYQELEIAALRLNTEVENLLHMSRLESESIILNRDWIEVSELFSLAINKATFDGHKEKVTVGKNLPDDLYMLDVGLISYALSLLIHNAIKYTREGTKVSLDASFDGDKLTLSVADNGGGIPLGYEKKIFDKFFRIPNTGISGSGLGLSIVKGLVEIHGGKIEVQNQPTRGIKFLIGLDVDVSYLKNLKNE